MDNVDKYYILYYNYKRMNIYQYIVYHKGALDLSVIDAKINLEKVKIELDELTAILSKIMTEKVSRINGDSIKAFQEFFKNKGFDLTNFATQEAADGIMYKVENYTAKYNSLVYNLAIPDSRMPYFGVSTVYTLSEGEGLNVKEYHMHVVREGNVRGVITRSINPNATEIERLNKEIERYKDEAERVKNIIENQNEMKFTFTVKENQKSFDEFSKALNETLN